MDFKMNYSISDTSFYYSREELPQPELFERHCHSNYELIHVVEGEGRYIVEGEAFLLTGGTVLLIHPYQYHYVSLRAGAAYERYVVNFSSDLLYPPVSTHELMIGSRFGGRVYFPKLNNRKLFRAALDSFCEIARHEGEDNEISGVSARSKSAGVTSLTRLSVHWAERTTATSRVKASLCFSGIGVSG